MKTMIGLALFLFGIALLGMVALVGLARREAARDVAWIYYLDDTGLNQVRTDGHGRRVISERVTDDDAFAMASKDGQWLIFGREDNNLYRIHRESGAFEMLTDVPSSDGRYFWRHSDEWLTTNIESAQYRVRENGRDFGVFLTDNDFESIYPWVLDDQSLLFQGNKDLGALYHADLETEVVRQLTHHRGGYIFDARFGGDGEWVIYGENIEDQAAGWFLIRPDGTERQPIVELSSPYFRPQFSPDGEWIVYEVCEDAGCWLYRMRPAGGAVERIVSTEDGANALNWLSDGRLLVLTIYDDCDLKLYRLNVDRAEMVRLGSQLSMSCELSGFADVSPDDRWMVYLDYYPTRLVADLWLIPTDGGQAIELIGGQHSPSFRAWSRNGEWMVVAGWDDPAVGQELFRVNVETGAWVQLSEAASNPRYVTGLPVVEREYGIEMLVMVGIGMIGGGLCGGFWFSRR